MAKLITAATETVRNLQAHKLVYDKETLTNEEPSSKKLKPSSTKDSSPADTPIAQNDFYWDQILLYLASGILGLSLIDISIEFFRGSIVQCYISDATVTREQAAYLSNYCYNSLPSSQYYLIFILISALIIIAPHYLWKSYFKAHFDFFFDLAKKLDRLRDTKTGEYGPYNFELVKKLEQKFSSSKPLMFYWYILKLLAQLGVCVIVETVNAFYFKADDFNESFLCPTDTGLLNTTAWPLPEQLNCVYNSLTLLYFLRNTALGLVAAAIVVIMIGLVWCFMHHTNELGAKDIAAFCDVSCLPPEEYTIPPLWKVVLSIFSCAKSNQNQDGHFCCQIKQKEDDLQSTSNVHQKFKQAFSPRIQTDLDFLVMQLFYADSGHGQVFKDIQIQKELEYRVIEDHKLLYLLNMIYKQDLMNKRDSEKQYKDVQDYFFKADFDRNNIEQSLYSEYKDEIGAGEEDWSHSTFRNELFRLFRFASKNRFALDISFGNRRGHSLILARAFSQSVTIHFNKYYKNEEEVCHRDDYQANYHTLTLQNDIYGQNADSNTKSDEPIIKYLKYGPSIKTINFIVVGPITERSDVVTTNILLQKIYRRNKYFDKEAVLLAIRPLEIGFKQCSEHFIQYKPPQGIFADHKKCHTKKVRVECVSVQCDYEFKMYEYTGNKYKENLDEDQSREVPETSV